MRYCEGCWAQLTDDEDCVCGATTTRPPDCAVCDDVGCAHCPAVGSGGFDSLVDRLMADGYDRAEAERKATERMEAA